MRAESEEPNGEAVERTPRAAHRLLRLAEVESRVLLKRTAIYARIAEGKFPPPRKDGRRVAWYEADIDAYLSSGHNHG